MQSNQALQACSLRRSAEGTGEKAGHIRAAVSQQSQATHEIAHSAADKLRQAIDDVLARLRAA